jgi:hypothetical protein
MANFSFLAPWKSDNEEGDYDYWFNFYPMSSTKPSALTLTTVYKIGTSIIVSIVDS